MDKTRRVRFYVYFVLLVCSLAAGAAELFGISVCLFGTPLHQYIAIPICLFSVLLCVSVCQYLVRETTQPYGKLQCKLLCAVCIVLCGIIVCVTALTAALTATHYAGQSISDDKAYKIFYETEPEGNEPIAHLYRRHSPFLMTYCNSAVLYGFAGEDLTSVEPDWGEAACTLYYIGYPEEAESADDLQTLSRKLYYSPNTHA